MSSVTDFPTNMVGCCSAANELELMGSILVSLATEKEGAMKCCPVHLRLESNTYHTLNQPNLRTLSPSEKTLYSRLEVGN